jgi:hypothetical protein
VLLVSIDDLEGVFVAGDCVLARRAHVYREKYRARERERERER